MGGERVKDHTFKVSLMRLVPTVNGFGLVLDGIHGPGHGIDGQAHVVKKGGYHVGGGAFDTKINFKVRYRQAAGQVFEQQSDIGRCGKPKGRGEPVFPASF